MLPNLIRLSNKLIEGDAEGTGDAAGQGGGDAPIDAQTAAEISDVLSDYFPPAKDDKSDAPGKAERDVPASEGAGKDADKEDKPKDGDKEGKDKEAGGKDSGSSTDKEVTKEKEKAKEKEKDEDEDEDEEKAELRTKLAAQAIEIEQLKAAGGKKPSDDTGKKPTEGAETQDLIVEFFENDEEYDKAFEDKKVMNRVLARVQKRTADAMATTVQKAVENHVAVALATKDFYKENPDLVQHAKIAGIVANEILASEPTLTIEQLYGKLGDAVRTKLSMKKPKAKADDKDKEGDDAKRKRPTFAKTGGSRAPVDKKPEGAATGIAKEIEELAAI